MDVGIIMIDIGNNMHNITIFCYEFYSIFVHELILLFLSANDVSFNILALGDFGYDLLDLLILILNFRDHHDGPLDGLHYKGCGYFFQVYEFDFLSFGIFNDGDLLGCLATNYHHVFVGEVTFHFFNGLSVVEVDFRHNLMDFGHHMSIGLESVNVVASDHPLSLLRLGDEDVGGFGGLDNCLIDQFHFVGILVLHDNNP